MSKIRIEKLPQIPWHTLPNAAAAKFFAVVPDIGVMSGEVEARKQRFGSNAKHGLSPQAAAHYYVKVRRDHSEQLIPLSDLVLGDIVILERGVRAPAHLRLIKARDLRADESNTKTAQSVAHKRTHTGSMEVNCLIPGAFVEAGYGEAIVIAHEQAPDMPSRDLRPINRRLRRLGLVVQRPSVTKQLAQIRSCLVTASLDFDAIRRMIVVASDTGVEVSFIVQPDSIVPQDLTEYVKPYVSIPHTLGRIRRMHLHEALCLWINDGSMMPHYKGVADVSIVPTVATDADKVKADLLAVDSLDTSLHRLLYNT